LNPGARLHRQEPDGSCYLPEPELLKAFKDFLTVDLRLSEITVQGHLIQLKRFLKWVKENKLDVAKMTRDQVRAYLNVYSKSSAFSYANVLKTLKRFFRDYCGKPEIIETFRLPKKPLRLKTIPKKEDLKRFYCTLDSKIGRALFLIYASSGLRKLEVLGLRKSDVDFSKRMIKPDCHNGETKYSYISFFNGEAELALKEYLATRKDKGEKLFRIGTHPFLDLWKRANEKTQLHITPQVLREWFCSEMVAQGISDSYVDAFCGRIPRSILARHYLDYSPEKLKEVYDKANLRILG
jgi:site-specific recombinase XerD